VIIVWDVEGQLGRLLYGLLGQVVCCYLVSRCCGMMMLALLVCLLPCALVGAVQLVYTDNGWRSVEVRPGKALPAP
jgi:hypothetical protein